MRNISMAEGVRLTLLIGENKPKELSSEFLEALKSIEVTQSDAGGLAFQIIFAVGREGRNDLKDYNLLKSPRFKVFNRIIITLTLGAKAQVLIDGIITHQQFSPSLRLRDSTFTITGEDISIMMDLEEKSVEHTGQDEVTIARQIIRKYSKYRLTANVTKPRWRNQPSKNERIPTQQGTDLSYLRSLAQRFGYVFYIIPGLKCGENTAYWGPSHPQGKLDQALMFNMGSFTNVDFIDFNNNALSPTFVEGQVQDRKTNKIRPITEKESNRPTLSKNPALTKQPHQRTLKFRQTARKTEQAEAYAQAMINRSVADVVTVTGQLDTVRYGGLLQVRKKVALKGVGYSYDGFYYVKNVTHKIRRGEYKQHFTLIREGLGTTTEVIKSFPNL